VKSDTLPSLNRNRVLRTPGNLRVRLLARDGGLMSYGADLTVSFVRTADLVSRTLKGANCRPSIGPLDGDGLVLYLQLLQPSRQLA
jgi:hypothetical protein